MASIIALCFGCVAVQHVNYHYSISICFIGNQKTWWEKSFVSIEFSKFTMAFFFFHAKSILLKRTIERQKIGKLSSEKWFLLDDFDCLSPIKVIRWQWKRHHDDNIESQSNSEISNSILGTISIFPKLHFGVCFKFSHYKFSRFHFISILYPGHSFFSRRSKFLFLFYFKFFDLILCINVDAVALSRVRDIENVFVFEQPEQISERTNFSVTFIRKLVRSF